MPRDYTEVIAALRRKAADKATPDAERLLLEAKASELEKIHAKTIKREVVDFGVRWAPGSITVLRQMLGIPDDFFDESYGQEEDTDEEGVGW